VLAVAFSPDEKLLATAGSDRTIKLWDLLRGRELLTLQGHTDSVTGLAFSPDRKLMVSTGADKTIRLWEIGTGKELNTFRGHTAKVNCVAFSQDGKYVVTGSDDKQVRVWDLQIGNTITVFTKHTDVVQTVAFDPKGRYVISACEGANGVRVWRPLTAEEVAGSPGMDASFLALSADGMYLALAYNHKTGKPRVRILDVVGWKEITHVELPDKFAFVTQVTFSPDGKHLAASCLDEKVRIWDAMSGKEVAILHTENAVRTIAYSRDGLRLACGTDDQLVMVWALPGSEARTLFKGMPYAASVAFNGDGRQLVGMCEGTARIWDTSTGAEVGLLHGRSGRRRLAWSAVDDQIAGVKPGELLNAKTGVTTKLREGVVIGRQFNEHAFSDDGSMFASAAGNDDRIAIWDTVTGQILHNLDLGQKSVSGVAFSPGGRLVAAGTSSVGVALKPGNNGSLCVWDARTGKIVLPPKEFLLQVWGLAFSPNGKWLAVAMGPDFSSPQLIGQVQVWNTETWKVVYNLRGHTGCAWTVCFSPDSKRLASVGGASIEKASTGELKIWDMATGQEVWSVAENTTYLGVAFSPDGRRIATAARDGTFKLWDGTPLVKSPQYQAILDDQ
jgi:WD40 repeat protein